MTQDERNDLVPRLLFLAAQVGKEGHLNAERYMYYAADEIAFLRYELMLKDKRLRGAHQ
jgi:hypothetical protein